MHLLEQYKYDTNRTQPNILIMKNLLALLAVLVSAISLHAQVAQVVVSGSVRDAETGEALAGSRTFYGLLN